MATLSADQVRKILNSSALSDQQITEWVALMEELAWALLAWILTRGGGTPQ